MKKIISLTTMAILISGCATGEQNSGSRSTFSSSVMDSSVVTKLSSVEDKKAFEVSNAQREELRKALSNMEEFCTPKLTSMEKISQNKSENAYWLSVAGAVSGAVIAPALIAANAAANAGAIAAFSGFGGATNFLSKSLESSGNSGTADAKTRNAIVEKIWEKLNIAFDEKKTIGERLSAVDAAKASCSMYSIYVPTATELSPK